MNCMRLLLTLDTITEKERERQDSLYFLFLSLILSKQKAESIGRRPVIKKRFEFILCNISAILVRMKYICMHEL